MSKPKKEDDLEKDPINDLFDSSYSDEIKDHLSMINMDPWYYIYANYVNPTPKKDRESINNKRTSSYSGEINDTKK